MYTEEAAFLLLDFFLIDDLEVFEVLDWLDYFVDEIDVLLAATQRQLKHHHCQHTDDEVEVECEECVY